MQYAIPKGTFDVLPYEPNEEDVWRISERWQYVENHMRKLANDYQCREIRTPIFERTELFIRGVGESSDIVNKEMYTFLDKADRSMTLRPEGTASAMRAFVENKLHALAPIHKFFYIGPMFRYERPQAGRYRQHHQFGVEILGSGSAEQDVEVIDLLCELYRRLGLKNLTVMINTVGDKESRGQYRKALEDHFRSHLSSLSEDSKIRFEKNILRILDSKSPEDQEAIAHAPSIQEFLTPFAKKHFETVCQLLTDLGLQWQINSRLVRGLDYYNHTVFEVASSHLGAQNALGGGGRYDGLIPLLGGPDIPSIGFATGLERILVAMHKQNVPFPTTPGPFIYFIGMDESARKMILPLLAKIRHSGVPSDMDLLGKKIQQALHLADQAKAKFVVVIGEEEMKSGKAMLKEMETRQSFPVSIENLYSHILELYAKVTHD
jgi:histidyl-tRNA synthetase